MNYLIIGCGGIGGVLAGYLGAGGKDVAIAARGAQLDALKANGLTVKRISGGDLYVNPVKAYAPDEDLPAADVIFVCVKGYSLMDSIPVIEKASDENTVIIPVLNSLSAGKKLRARLPDHKILDGCIYTSASILSPGIINQAMDFVRVVFGEPEGIPGGEKLCAIANELEQCGIIPVLSDNIQRDVFKKFIYISAFAATDTYYDVSAADIQKPGRERTLFISLVSELMSIAKAKAMKFDCDLEADTIAFLDRTNGDVTTSFHKDVAAGNAAEKRELFYDVVELGRELGVATPNYEKIAAHFGYKE